MKENPWKGVKKSLKPGGDSQVGPVKPPGKEPPATG